MVPGSMLLAVCLFLGLIGFNPQLAFGVEAAAAALESAQGPRVQDRWVVPPGDWSGSLANRMQALGYEVASINLASGVITVTFDDGRVLTVDRNTGAFAVVDAAEQPVMNGAVTGQYDAGSDEMAMDATVEFAEDPGVQHAMTAGLTADATTNGRVVMEGSLDSDTVNENVDLMGLSYRPDGSTTTSERALASPAAVLAGDAVPMPDGLRINWVLVLVVVGLLCVVLMGTCVAKKMLDQREGFQQERRMRIDEAAGVQP
jgi:hypothetical protein